jgi:hypothetical protein
MTRVAEKIVVRVDKVLRDVGKACGRVQRRGQKHRYGEQAFPFHV